MAKLDPRLHAYREDLADEKLKGQVVARQWAKGLARSITASVASLHGRPDENSMQLTQALFGEACSVFENHNGWAWIQLSQDGYVGYVRENALGALQQQATHRVANIATWCFSSAELKSQPAVLLYMNTRVTVSEQVKTHAVLHNGGSVFAGHLRRVEHIETDFVAVAEKFLHVPYYWGGKTCAGMDCSGLVQTALRASGIAAPRDTDMQEQALGAALKAYNNLQRGDLVYWPGHVGIMQSATQLIHANGHFMMVVSEPLAQAVARSEKSISSVRRLANDDQAMK